MINHPADETPVYVRLQALEARLEKAETHLSNMVNHYRPAHFSEVCSCAQCVVRQEAQRFLAEGGK